MLEFFYRIFFKEEFEPRIWTWILVVLFQILVSASLAIGAIYVIAHFIHKYW